MPLLGFLLMYTTINRIADIDLLSGNYSQNGPNPKRPRTKRPKSETALSKTAQLFGQNGPTFFLSEMGLICDFEVFIFQRPSTPTPPPPPPKKIAFSQVKK